MGIVLLLVAASDLRVLTFNIAGLPQVVSQAMPARDTAKIGALLRDYDVALVQEDFWYHAELIGNDRHVYRSRPYSETPSFFDIGDGLNQLSKFPFARFERSAWRQCSGALACSNDCMASKGYSFSVLQLPNMLVHLYNLHMDAGECATDFPARAAQLKQLARTIAKQSKDMPLIVAGDTNLDVSFPEDREAFEAFLRETGLRDSCRVVSCGRELIDRVMVRGPLEPMSWSTPETFAGLSDHEAVSVRIRYTTEQLISAF